MSTTTTTTTPSATSVATSVKFRTFAIVFSLAAPLVYMACELLSLPLFTFHPATNRIDLGWAPGRSGEGPAMYWYGWVFTTLIGSSVLGWLGTLLPQSAIRKIPLALIWILPILVLLPLFWSLKPFWEKGGWF